jgi:ribose transport system permease protein
MSDPNLSPRRKALPQSALSIAFLVLLVVVFSALNGSFLVTGNLRGLALSSSVLLIAACGTAFVILMGSIDLSVGATASMAGMLVAYFLPSIGMPALLIGPMVGLAIGLLNGGLYVSMRIPSIITTLGMSTALSGAIFFISDGQSIPVSDPAVLNLTQGGPLQVLPFLAFYALAIYAVCAFIHERTQIGRTIFALGGDERVVILLGAKLKSAKVTAFALSGLLAGTAGTLLMSRLGTAAARMGDYLTLDTITAVVVGGISILGGSGTIRSLIIGVLIISVLSSGMNILSIHPYLQTVIKGSIIVLAVLASGTRPSAEDVK